MVDKSSIPCRQFGCPRLSKDGTGYCESHGAKSYTQQWCRLRAEILKRDKHLCQECRRQGLRNDAREVDHITPKAYGGTDNLDNLESICIYHHWHKAARDKKVASSAPR